MPKDDAAAARAARPARIVVIRDHCTRVAGAECGRCALACPKGAISFTEEGLPAIDEQACSKCGICFGICDAFSSTRITMIDVHARIRRIALRGDRVMLTCKENLPPGFEPADNVVVLPCLACLSPELWAVVLAENIEPTIACDLSYCADCTRAGAIAETLYTHAIETAQAWTGRTVGFAREIPEKEREGERPARGEGADRRAAFENLLGDVGDITSGKRRLRNSATLQRIHEQRERSRAAARLNLSGTGAFSSLSPEGRTRKIMTPKRLLLLEALDRLPEAAERVPVYLSATDADACDGCLACAKGCPTGARFVSPEDGTLAFDARYCISCGICVGVCPNGAVDIEEHTAEAFRAL